LKDFGNNIHINIFSIKKVQLKRLYFFLWVVGCGRGLVVGGVGCIRGKIKDSW
jgi:hypothetical protein